MHVYPRDYLPETQAGTEGEQKNEEEKEEEEEEEGIEEAKPNIPSFLLNHKHHDSTVSLLFPQNHRNIHLTHTQNQAGRKRGSIVDAEAVGETTIDVVGSVFDRIRLNLHSAQVSQPQRLLNAPISREDTATSDFKANKDLTVFPRSEEEEEEEYEERKGEEKKMGAGVENEETKENTGERGEREEGIEEWDAKIVKENENGKTRENNEETENNVEIKEESEEGLERGDGEERNDEEVEEKKGEPSGGAWEATVLVSLSDGPARSPPAACRKVVVEVDIPSFIMGG